MPNTLGTATIVIDTDNPELKKSLAEAKKIINDNLGDIEVEAGRITTAISNGVGAFIAVAIKETFNLAKGFGGVLDSVADVAGKVKGEFATQFVAGLGSARSAISPVIDSINSMGFSFEELLSPMGVATVAFDVLKRVAVQNINVIIDFITDFINGFVDLYNESLVFRAGIESIRLHFNNLYAIGKFVINSFINGFGTIGRVIKAALTGNFGDIPDIVKGGFADTFDNITTLAGDVGNNIGTAIGNTLSNRLERVQREDVADFFNGFVTQAKDTAVKVADAVSSIVPRGQIAQVASIGSIEQNSPIVSTGSTDFYKELQAEISKTIDLNKAFGESYDIVGEQTKLYEAAITSLISNGLNPLSPEVTELQEKLNELSASTSSVVQDIKLDLGSLVSGFFESMSEAALAGGSLGDILNAGLSSVFASLGGLMIQLGQVAIRTAVGITAIRAALSSLNPVVAAIAGGALIAFGSVIKSSVQDLAAPKLAQGGLAFGETLAVVGDNPNADIDPEVIAPLSKLKNIINDAGGGSQTLRAMVKGEDLLLVSGRAAENQKRITGV